MKAIQQNKIPAKVEELTIQNQYNEYIMTGLRTQWGVSANYIKSQFGENYLSDFLFQIHEYVESGAVEIHDDKYLLTLSGKLIADRIAAKAFVV